jgi:hypothetical protein
MSTHEAPVSEYAPQPPRSGDPLKLAGVTIQAVDQIGERTAAEIERTAESIVAGADEVASNLYQLANAIRGHSKVASDHVEQFVSKTTEVLGTVRELLAKIADSTPNGQEADAEAAKH